MHQRRIVESYGTIRAIVYFKLVYMGRLMVLTINENMGLTESS